MQVTAITDSVQKVYSSYLLLDRSSVLGSSVIGGHNQGLPVGPRYSPRALEED
jgi:hypothetical protein